MSQKERSGFGPLQMERLARSGAGVEPQYLHASFGNLCGHKKHAKFALRCSAKFAAKFDATFEKCGHEEMGEKIGEKIGEKMGEKIGEKIGEKTD